jgi:hypothetical protein
MFSGMSSSSLFIVSRCPGLYIALLLLAAAACGDSATETKDQPLVSLDCEDGFMPTTTVGVRQLVEGDCLDTDEAVVLELCAVGKGYSSPYLACVQSDTGERYWVRNHDQQLGETTGFTPCSDAEEVSPPPCFVGNCGPNRTDAPFSNCSQEQTEVALRCGVPDSPWDENCCRRPNCQEDGTCEPGFACRLIGGYDFTTYPYATTDAEGNIVCEPWPFESWGFQGCFPE